MKKKKHTLISLILVTICLLLAAILLILQEDSTPYVHNPVDTNPNKDEQIIPSTNLSPTISLPTTPTPLEEKSILSPAIVLTTEADNPTISTEMIITDERQNYRSGDLTLIIPKLNFTDGVENGTDEDTLNLGPALYEYAQLPGEGDRNVSIAAHRNTRRNGVIEEWYFYYIDTLTTGDLLYLTDGSFIYQYEYNQTTVVDPYDWTPIYRQGFSCLTLTSCEPIGISTHRIIVRSKLVEIFPYEEDFIYKPVVKEI